MCSQVIPSFSFHLLILFLTLVGCEELEIIPNISEVDQYVGNRLIITCKGESRMGWFDPKERQIEGKKGRIHIQQREENLLSLVFDQILAEDEGIWTCVANKTVRNFKLNVYESIKFLNLSKVQIITENRNEFVSCLVTGRPKPVVSWYFNGKKIEISNQKYIQLMDGLLIKNVSNDDSGDYICKAYQISHSISNIEEEIIQVKVRGSPIPLSYSESIFYGYLGGVTNLTCEFQPEYPARISWFREGNSSINQQAFEAKDLNLSHLPVYINDSSSYGEYFCNATNDYGNTVLKVYLSQGKKPKIPQRILLRNVGLNFLKFYVKNVGTEIMGDDMEIFGYRFEVLPKMNSSCGWKDAVVYEFNVRRDNLYGLANLKEDTVYLIRVASRNIAGLSDWSKTFRYSTGLQSEFLAFTSKSTKLTLYLPLLLIPSCFMKIVINFI